MANKIFFAGILVTALVFGITVIACNNGSTDKTDSAKTDSALNGTWVKSDGTIEYEFDEGDFECSYNGRKASKGTYTTKDGKVTMTATHIWGKVVENSLEAKWYSRADLKAAGESEATLANRFRTTTWSYSVNGDKLTIFGGTYTKKP